MCWPQLKKVLSANAEATIHVECLMNDVDVSGSMTREVFEELIQPLIDRIKITCAKVGPAQTMRPFVYVPFIWIKQGRMAMRHSRDCTLGNPCVG